MRLKFHVKYIKMSQHCSRDFQKGQDVIIRLTHCLLSHNASGLLYARRSSRGSAALSHRSGLARRVSTPAFRERAVHYNFLPFVDAT